jgi:glycosyltransferase involved in cell wall biosynthesis
MNIGGPAVLLTQLSNDFAETDIDHFLITGACLDNEEDYLDQHEINTKLIRLPTLARSPLLIRDMRTFFKLAHLIHKIKPDIVHTHTSKAGVLGRLAAVLSFHKCKIIHTYHGHLLYGYFNQIIKSLIVFIERLLALFTDHLIAVSEQIKIDLLEVGIGTPKKWKVIHPGILIPNLNNVSNSKFDRSDAFLKICWVGRFSDIKNPFLAINSFRNLPSIIRNNSSFTMVGDGELLNQSKEYANELGLPIVFTGNLPDIDSIISTSNLLLITSRNEGFPLVMLEAAARKTPVVATNVGGIRDFITNQKYGYLCQESVHDISSHISNVFTHKVELKEIAENAYDKVLSEFNHQIYFCNHYELYKWVQRKK